MISPSTETGRRLYQISVAAPDTEQAETVVARVFCPDPDHAPPCPVPWDSRRMAGDRWVHFEFYATDDQAHEILAEVTARNFPEVRLFESVDEDGQPLDGTNVIQQFRIERDLPET